MTDQPPAYSLAEELLATADQLYSRAVRLALRALPDDDDSRWTDDQALTRAAQVAAVASAGFRGAQAMVGLQHLDLLREFEERVEARTADGNDQPGVFPCPDCGQEFGQLTALDHHLTDEHDRDPYEPPTLTGPHDPDRTHDR